VAAGFRPPVRRQKIKKFILEVGTEEVNCLYTGEEHKALIVVYNDGSIEVRCDASCGSQCQYRGGKEKGKHPASNIKRLEGAK